MIQMAEADNRKQIAVIAAVVVVLLVASAGGVWAFTRSQTQEPEVAGLADDDIAGLIERVGKLIELPSGEEPTVASVADVEQLKAQPFFTNAQVGDRVLIYAQAKKAFLYRPSTNKLIEVAPVVLDPNATSSATQVAESAEFVLYNGTEEAGLAETYEETLTSSIPSSIVVSRANAVGSYGESILVDLTGEMEADAATYAQALGMTVGSLPEEEEAPDDGQFLIILGQDVAEAR